MDGLALFCTLHADGPATLRELRRAGCADLEALQALGAERLAELLELEPALARRWIREAKALAERMGEAALEREEAPPGAPQLAAPPAAAIPPSSAPESDGRPGGSQLGAERRALERVLEAWRERDHAEPAPERELARTDGRVSERALEREALPSGTPPELLPHALDGLDEASCRALRTVGIESLAELAAADALEVAQASGLAYSRVRRFIFLAARRHEELAVRVSPAERPAESTRGLVERELVPRPSAGAPGLLERVSRDGLAARASVDPARDSGGADRRGSLGPGGADRRGSLGPGGADRRGSAGAGGPFA